MLNDTDINKLKQAAELISEVADNIDCEVCKAHVDTTINMINDLEDITKLQVAYNGDPEAINKLMEMVQDEGTLRILALGSRLLVFYRKIISKITRK